MQDNATALDIAVRERHTAVVKELLLWPRRRQAAADDFIEKRDKEGLTPLFRTAQYGYVEAVAALLQAGANKDAEDKDGATPLYVAAEKGHVEVVAALLQARANKEAANKDGATPLYAAAMNGHGEVFAALLQAGADKEAANKVGPGGGGGH
ncbi:hypothetical protein GPECTOR_794g17 [Gonium pectorale]|uniref:Uncharacterized protein n=1 Tax=Gonium pectorale TaxID=33097 RepID=A0A150FU02_GONPE|nr:hypothetical protein GPECTOR_794g17 [Gonium pectorale]|eukprot:KXZ41102.1 hypothetical protein GPECTOR_794g17 [Gonium pectorale]